MKMLLRHVTCPCARQGQHLMPGGVHVCWQPPVGANGSGAPAFDWLHVYELIDALNYTTHGRRQPAVVNKCSAVAPAAQHDVC